MARRTYTTEEIAGISGSAVSFNRFIVPPKPPQPVLTQPDLRQTKQAVQEQTLNPKTKVKEAGSGVGDAGPSTSSPDVGFHTTGVGVFSSKAVSLGNKALAAADEVTKITPLDFASPTSLGLKVVLGAFVSKAKQDAISKQRSKSAAERRGFSNDSKAGRTANVNAFNRSVDRVRHSRGGAESAKARERQATLSRGGLESSKEKGKGKGKGKGAGFGGGAGIGAGGGRGHGFR